MLYDQLHRINQLDTQIQDMHNRLAEFYSERAALISNDQPVVPVLAANKNTDTKAIYKQLQAAWKPYNLVLPTYKTLSKRLTKAQDIMQALLLDNPQLTNNLQLIVVPPQKQLEAALEQSDSLQHNYVFTEEYQNKQSRGANSWGLLIITSASFGLPVDSVSDTLGKDEFRYKKYDCRGLGVREAIAADIQGIEVVTGNNWTLLLKDATDASYIPCVTKQDNQLVFDIDDAGCLLGNNYVQPAVAVQ